MTAHSGLKGGLQEIKKMQKIRVAQIHYKLETALSLSLGRLLHLSVNRVENSTKHYDSTQYRGPLHWMVEVDSRNNHGYDLPCGHDDSKHNRTKLCLNCVVDEQLSGGTGNGSNDVVEESQGIVEQELYNLRNFTTKCQS